MRKPYDVFCLQPYVHHLLHLRHSLTSPIIITILLLLCDVGLQVLCQAVQQHQCCAVPAVQPKCSQYAVQTAGHTATAVWLHVQESQLFLRATVLVRWG